MELEKLIVLQEFCKHHSISDSFILSLHDFEIVEIISINNTDYFHEDSLGKVEKIIRLHIDLSINIEGIDVILRLLENIESLESELIIAKNTINLLSVE